MAKNDWWLIGAGCAAAVGVVLAMNRKKGPGARVFHLERAMGVDARLRAFLGRWQTEGHFPILVAPEGGRRTDPTKQLRLFAEGVTKARTLEETPHGRGGALDLVPCDPTGKTPFWSDTAAFSVIGEFAEAMGLEWGGRWTGLVDMPHIQVPDWRSLPFPPYPLGVA